MTDLIVWLIMERKREMTRKKLYRIETHGYGVHYRYAMTAQKARAIIVTAIFGRRYEGYEHEYWTVTEEVR